MTESDCSVVQKYKLDRWQDHKVYVGRAEWLMVIEQALLDSELYGRMVKLQILCAGDMTFFWTLRPGSLGPSYDEFAELGYVSVRLVLQRARS
jgi:hypothetical protein